MHGIRMVNKNLINASKIMGGSGFVLFKKVLLPGSLVSIMPGLRLAIGYSWRALVGAEMLAAMLNWGIGKMIYSARFWNDVELMFLGLIIIGLAGLSLDYILMRNIEKYTIEKWGMIKEG
jgi:ABC-type nitrate/sulfonate/bicarbonate transport system permease component